MSLILPTKTFTHLNLTLIDSCAKIVAISWNDQNREVVIRVDYYTDLTASQIAGVEAVATEYYRISEYDKTIPDNAFVVAYNYFKTLPEFSGAVDDEVWLAAQQMIDEEVIPALPEPEPVPQNDGYLN